MNKRVQLAVGISVMLVVGIGLGVGMVLLLSKKPEQPKTNPSPATRPATVLAAATKPTTKPATTPSGVPVLRVFDGKEPVKKIATQEAGVFARAVSSDGKMLAWRDGDKLKLLRRGETLTLPSNAVLAVFSADDSLLAAADNTNGMTVFATADGAVKATRQLDKLGAFPALLQFLSRDELLRVSAAGAIDRWDWSKNVLQSHKGDRVVREPSLTLPTPNQPLYSLAFVDDKKEQRHWRIDGVKVRDDALPSGNWNTGKPEDERAPVVGPRGDCVLQAENISGQLRMLKLFESMDGKFETRPGGQWTVGKLMQQPVFSPDGGMVVTVGVDGTVSLWDVRDTKAPLSTVTIVGPAFFLPPVFSADGNTLLLSSQLEISVWKLKQQK